MATKKMTFEPPTAIKVRFDDNTIWFRCSECYSMFSYMTYFEETTYYEVIPRLCPNCGSHFYNGMKEINT